MGLTEQLKNVLYDCGADLVGIGDISKVENSDFNVGIAVAATLPKNVIIDLRTAPTKEYYEQEIKRYCHSRRKLLAQFGI